MALFRVRDIPVITLVKVITAVIGILSFASVSPHLDTVYSLSFAMLFVISLFFEITQRFLFPRWVLTFISLGVIFMLVMRLDLADPVVPIVEALVVLLGIKFLEKKEFRDYMQIFAIAVLLLAASSLLSLSMTFVVFLLALIFLLSLAIVFLTFHSQDPGLTLDRRTAGRIVQRALLIPLYAIPLTVLLFVILPRTKYPLFNFLNAMEKTKTGFSENVGLGEISEIQEDTTVIMRVRTERMSDDLLYWRGIVLDRFDGRQWSARTVSETTYQGLSLKGRRVAQTIYLEPYENRYLFGLDMPVSYTAPRRVTYKGDGVFALSAPVDRRIQYETVSVVSTAVPASPPDPSVYLQVPSDTSSRIRELTAEITRHKRPEDRVKALFDFFRSGAFNYSLTNLPVSDSPLDDFLFTYRYGNCEYFASAMALMLRLAGVPSRLVGGYRGGLYNEFGEYYIIPQKNAHVWVEAYIDGMGWVRSDPTPVGSEFFTSLTRSGFLMKIRFLFDSMNYYWNASVISYDLRKQVSLYTRLGAQIRNPRVTLEWARDRLLPAALGLLIAVSVVVLAYRTVRERRDPAGHIIQQFEKRMGKLGYQRKKSEGLEEFVARVGRDDLREKAEGFVKAFEKRYYRDERFSGRDVSTFGKMMREIE